MNNYSSLADLLDWYVSRWGPIEWHHLNAQDALEPDLEMGQMLHALSLIEADSQIQRRKLAAAGADRVQELLDFIVIWLAEEGEHSRALAHMAGMYGFSPAPLATRTGFRDVRSMFTWPSLYAARALPGLCATYCTLGTMQELVALTTYDELAKLSENEAVSDVLRAISVQESKHMRFYRNAALIFLADSPRAQQVTRRLIKRLWRPPGMDLLGAGNFESIFAPILDLDSYTSRLLNIDRVVQELPGMQGIRVMERYLERSDRLPGRRSPAQPLEAHAV